VLQLAGAAIRVRRHDQPAAGPQHPARFVDDASFVAVGDVLDDVEDRDEIERRLSKRQRGAAARDEPRVGHERARMPEGALRHIDADRPRASSRVGGEASVAAADVEQRRPRRRVGRRRRHAGDLQHDGRAQVVFLLVVRPLAPVIRRGVLPFLQPRLQ